MIRVVGLWHCIGVGGGDGFACSLAHYTPSIEWTDVLLSPVFMTQFVQDHLERAKDQCGGRVRRWHAIDTGHARVKGVVYHKTLTDAINSIPRPDLYHSWGFSELDKVAYHTGLPVVDHAQGQDDFAKQICTSNSSDLLIRVAVSNSVAKAMWPDNDNVIVIPNGVDTRRIFPRVGRTVARKAWDIPQEAKVILSLQRVTPDKNGAALFQTLSELNTRDRVEKRAPQYYGLLSSGVSNNRELDDHIVRYLYAGQVAHVAQPWTNPGDLFAAADCFLLASDSEGWSVALMEALGAGLPCVVSSCSAHLELAERYPSTVQLVPIRPTSATLATAVEKVTSPEWRANSWKAQQIVLNNYTMSSVAARWELLFQDIALRDSRNRVVPLVRKIKPRPYTTDAAFTHAEAVPSIGAQDRDNEPSQLDQEQPV